MHRRVWHVCEVANKSFVNQFTACPQLSRLEPCAPVARVHSSSSPPEGRISVPNTAKRERDGNRVWMDLQSVRERLQQLQASGCHIDKPAVRHRPCAPVEQSPQVHPPRHDYGCAVLVAHSRHVATRRDAGPHLALHAHTPLLYVRQSWLASHMVQPCNVLL